MADLAPAGNRDSVAASGGPLGQFARGQYAALAHMRARMLVNGFRSNRGVVEFSARAVSYTMYCVIGLSMGVGAAAAAFSMVAQGQWRILPIEFWVLCLIWQAVAIALASFQEQFDLTGLLRFPVGFTSFYGLFLIFGLLDVTTLIGGLCCAGILAGVTLARPALFFWTLAILFLYGLFNVLLARAILAWIDRWLAKRRSREIISILFFLGLLSAQFVNPVLREDRMNGEFAYGESQTAHQWLSHMPVIEQAGNAAQAWLPPGLAAETLSRAAHQNGAEALALVGLFGVWTLGAGGLLALRLRAEYRGENLGEASKRKEEKAIESGWGLARGPITAMIEKDLRTLFRSAPQLYSLLVPMLMVFLIGGLFHKTGSELRTPVQFALPVCVAYGVLGFTQLIYNSLGPEGTGIQLLFIAPIPMRTVLLAKNLFQAILYGFIAVASGVLACLHLGWPSGIAAASTVAWILFALPANMAAGNIISLTMPYRVNLGRIGRQSGSQGNALLSMLIQASLLGIGAAVLSVCSLLRSLWIAPAILLVLAAIATAAWFRILGNSDAIANRRRDLLIEKLARTE